MVIYDSFLFAVVAALCVPDDSGRPAIVARIAQRLPLMGGRPTSARLLVVAIVVLTSASDTRLETAARSRERPNSRSDSRLNVCGEPRDAYPLVKR